MLSEVGFSGREEVTSDGDVGICVVGTLVDGCVGFSATLVDGCMSVEVTLVGFALFVDCRVGFGISSTRFKIVASCSRAFCTGSPA